MKTIVAILMSLSVATTVPAAGLTKHPLFGKWTWTRKENNCTEVYDYRPDHTSRITSGDEVSESRFTITDKPDINGFYRMVDEVTKDNGRAGCDGTPGGSPIGDKATTFVYIRQPGDEMVMCEAPSFSSCFGPLKRIAQ
jgi:hypothetical protein